VRVVTKRGSPSKLQIIPEQHPEVYHGSKSQPEPNQRVLTGTIRKEVKILNLTTNKQHPGSDLFDSREALLYNRHTP